jgi:DMSO/TMAO reductase YedYZ molybdopterin-dependent catalytic subunit
VLSAGPTPRIDTDEWQFTITAGDEINASWTWAQLQTLPMEDISTDIHCVTTWSKIGTQWRGVSVDTLFEDVSTSAAFAMAHSYGGYTTNLPMEDIRGGKAWIALEYDGLPLEPEHGGPARLLVPHLYLWKSAKWVQGLRLMDADAPGFWEQKGYHMYGDPWKEQRYS